MRSLLEHVLPRLLPEGWHPRIIPHQGWSDLQQSLPRKLKAWRAPSARFIVMRDNDRGDCRARKRRILSSVAGTGREEQTKVRIVCQELETWILGDLMALESVLGTVSSSVRRMAAKPDTIDYPAKVLERQYGSYSKVSGAAAIGREMDPDRNLSDSFQAFVLAVRHLTTEV